MTNGMTQDCFVAINFVFIFSSRESEIYSDRLEGFGILDETVSYIHCFSLQEPNGEKIHEHGLSVQYVTTPARTHKYHAYNKRACK